MKYSKILSLISAFMIFLFMSGMSTGMAEYGDSNDPLVTLSYINDVVWPKANTLIDTEISKKMGETQGYVTDKLNSHMSAVDAKIAQYMGTAALNQEDIDKIANQVVAQLKAEGISAVPSWAVVTLAEGKILKGEVGCEILLRAGEATAYSPTAGGIVNLTSGAELAPAKAVAANNLYLVSVDGRGVKGGRGCTLVVCGKYVIE